MPISWNEIRHNAIKFSRDWTGVTSESAEKQTFWNEFFQVFGIKRRVVASFEESVRKISGDYGRIDLFWPRQMLVEHKSFGEDLHKAETQAFQYIRELANDPQRRDEIPRYIIVSDFARIAIHDLEPEDQRDLPLFDKKRGTTHVFPLAEFHKNVQHFGQLYQRLPLKKSPHIHCANALRLDWKAVLPPEKCSYVLGNPPFSARSFNQDCFQLKAA